MNESETESEKDRHYSDLSCSSNSIYVSRGSTQPSFLPLSFLFLPSFPLSLFISYSRKVLSLFHSGFSLFHMLRLSNENSLSRIPMSNLMMTTTISDLSSLCRRQYFASLHVHLSLFHPSNHHHLSSLSFSPFLITSL